MFYISFGMSFCENVFQNIKKNLNKSNICYIKFLTYFDIAKA